MNDQILDTSQNANSDMKSQWLALAEKALRGAALQTLVKTGVDGIARGPLFDQRPGVASPGRADTPALAGRPWHNAPQVCHPDVKTANREALEELKGGASALTLTLDANGARGIAVQSLSDVLVLLSGVHTDYVPIVLRPETSGFETAALFAAHFDLQGKMQNTLLSPGLDPDTLTRHQLISAMKWAQDNAPAWHLITINAAKIHEAGGTAIQELAAMLAMTVETLDVLEENGLTPSRSVSFFEIHMAVGAETHWNICKLRAARLLWDRLMEVYGLAVPMRLHVTTSGRMLGRSDPWSNLLRIGSASFAAALGGADVITTLPFTQALGLPTGFARRIARNQQHLLSLESHLGQVADPARGSYTHETLSLKMAEKAWACFQDIEAQGGWRAAKDRFRQEVSEACGAKLARLKSGEDKLIGVNQYARPDIRKAEILPAPKIRHKSGPVIATEDFAQAIAQAQNGHIVPCTPAKTEFERVNFAQMIADGGQT